jgi:hypothetical protein
MSLSVSWDTGRIYRFSPWRRRPVPLVETAGEAVVGRIVDDVFQGRLVLLLRLDQLRPVAAAEEMVLPTVLLVESPCVATVQVTHAGVEVRGRGLDDQVVVVSHQAARVDAPAVAPLDASQEVEEDDAVFAVEHDRVAVVPAGHDVVVGPGYERAMRSSHLGDRSSARAPIRPPRTSCPTSGSDQSRARHGTGAGETAPIGACRIEPLRFGPVTCPARGWGGGDGPYRAVSDRRVRFGLRPQGYAATLERSRC